MAKVAQGSLKMLTNTLRGIAKYPYQQSVLHSPNKAFLHYLKDNPEGLSSLKVHQATHTSRVFCHLYARDYAGVAHPIQSLCA